MARQHFIGCLIERGGFSSERTFRVRSAAGEIVAGADVRYLRDAQKRPLDDATPPKGQPVSGFVECRIVRKADAQHVVVEVPSSMFVTVPESAVLNPA